MRLRSFITGVVGTVVVLLGVGLLSPSAVNAAVRYFSTTTTHYGTGWATCPYGTKVTGGGVGQISSNYYGSSSSDEYALTGSFPSGNGWRATATHVHGTWYSSSGWRFSSYSYSPPVYVICAG
ncbi:MAG: hypothetical protein ACXVYY_06100 [Oryzihumus sp.]